MTRPFLLSAILFSCVLLLTLTLISSKEDKSLQKTASEVSQGTPLDLGQGKEQEILEGKKVIHAGEVFYKYSHAKDIPDNILMFGDDSALEVTSDSYSKVAPEANFIVDNYVDDVSFSYDNLDFKYGLYKYNLLASDDADYRISPAGYLAQDNIILMRPWVIKSDIGSIVLAELILNAKDTETRKIREQIIDGTAFEDPKLLKIIEERNAYAKKTVISALKKIAKDLPEKTATVKQRLEIYEAFCGVKSRE